jgi:TetR/AcrR family transcriptional repressor of nem operon
MRYADTHKDETHRALLKAASAQLRERGPDRLSVASVMKAAGLTHGGFYAHFKSKDALLAEALADTFARSREKVRRLLGGLPPRAALAAYVDFYVSTDHRDHPATGCPLTALNSDMPRQTKKFRAAFESGVNEIANALAARMAAAGVEDAKRLAPSLLSAMAGAVALSRTISDKALSDELLASARGGMKARLGLSDIAGETDA